MAIFDRSWYGRVLVERVEGFCTKDEWRRAYREINEFERVLHDDGAIIVKMWLHITKEEQMSRFEKRAEDPLKHWKITDEDWRNRNRWKDYIAATEDMFARTSPDFAPWQVIPANYKWYARVKVLRTVCDRVGAALGVKPAAG
jgi:polyphosphate kinase 2 (PPK2 family)